MGIFDDVFGGPTENEGEVDNGQDDGPDEAKSGSSDSGGSGFLDDIINETIQDMGGSTKNDGWKDTGSDKDDGIWDTGEGWSTGETEDVWRAK